YRLWNRDFAAVLNFRNIVFSLRATSQKPASFSRSQIWLKIGKNPVFNNFPPKLSLWIIKIQVKP
ncbi:hypothetical protein EDC94DRAFT_525756, partial [Helicostylum pulchrum]